MIYGFDNDKYLKIQSEHIKERIAKFGNKLYLEVNYSTTITQVVYSPDFNPTSSCEC